ncbi:MAG: hypothetical protein OEW48_15100, partial [Phycisphaerae bacterium]|nr:hypothetical protein [Phycisphaerae bacterium]
GRKAFLVCLGIIFCSLPASAQEPGNTERLTSASAGNIFYEIAYEIANSADITSAEAEQAIIFLTAAMELDGNTADFIEALIKLTSQNSARDNSKLVYQLLTTYVDKSAEADLEPARMAIRYLLNQLNSREERENLLKEMLKNMGGKNAFLDSELDTSLGMLMAETPDSNSAQKYLMLAYYNNKYNKPAFAKLAELMTVQISPAMYLEHLRLILEQNPIDLEAALGFAQYAERLQLYETAAGAYQYCDELFGFLYPLQPLPASIYLPWAISCYNTQRNQHKCLQIAERLRQDDRFDLLLESIAAKAALKTGNPDLAKQIFGAAEKNAHLYLVNNKLNHNTKVTKYEQLAWFYCFARPDPNKAVDWANKAYSIGPNSSTAAALLAYSLVMNGETEWAKLLTSNYERNQITDLTLAQIQLAEGQKETAIQTLKSAITKDPGSLAAERAKEILTQQGGNYIPPVDPGTTLAVLKNSFGEIVVPTFIRPEKIISFELNLRGSKFSYGSDLGGAVAIINNSTQPLVVSDDGLFKGYIRIDADINGDLKQQIYNLLSVKIAPGAPIKPGRSIVVPVRLLTGELRQTLLTHPQASLDIEFKVHLDPIMIADGKLTNRLPGMKPANVLVKRPGIELTKKLLQNRLDSFTTGRQGQKIQTALLFTGLLKEQHSIAGSEPLYKMTSAEWMPALLQSALIHNLTRDDDWAAKVHTMAGMLSLPLEHELTSAVAENLSEKHWPARMMALYLLAKYQKSDFSKVLNWTAKYDSNKFVRDMAIALGAALPEKTTAEPVK